MSRITVIGNGKGMHAGHFKLSAQITQGSHVRPQMIQVLYTTHGHDDVGQTCGNYFHRHLGPICHGVSSHDGVQAHDIHVFVYRLGPSHLHHHLLADCHLKVTGKRVVDAHGPLGDNALAPQRPEGGNRRMTAQVHLGSWSEIAHSELRRAVLPHKGRLAVAQLSSYQPHQLIGRENAIPSQQHDTSRVPTEGLARKRINNKILHFIS